MTQNGRIFQKDEAAVNMLRTLFEAYGYTKFKMSRFEEYELYSQNKSFLRSENIITFTDMNGRLLALKPDITLSIVKSAAATRQSDMKVYYNEEVFRANPSTGDIKSIVQVGLEHIGEIDLYSSVETIALAVMSLRAISESYILDISHQGFVAGLLDAAGVYEQRREQLLQLIGMKNAHEIRRFCGENGVAVEMTERIVSLSQLYGGFESTAAEARALVCNAEMSAALGELESNFAALAALGLGSCINLDFSIVNDVDYYNGIIFQGFVQGVPCYVLSGGRYDRLLEKMGRATGAIGFAVYLDLLDLYDSAEREYDVDAVIIYDDAANAAQLAAAAKSLTDSGERVYVCKSADDIKYKKRYIFKDGRLQND